MIGTEVIDTTHHIHTGLQGFRLTNQRTGTPGQDIEMLPKGSIEPFNVSGVDATVPLAGLDQLSNLISTALHNPTVDQQFVPLGVA